MMTLQLKTIANGDKMEQPEASRTFGESKETSPTKDGECKKRDRTDAGEEDEVEATASRQRHEDRRKANEEAKDGSDPSNEAASKSPAATAAIESKEGDGKQEDSQTLAAEVQDKASQGTEAPAAGGSAGVPPAATAAAVQGADGQVSLQPAVTGVPPSLASTNGANGTGGGVPQAAQLNLMNQYPLLFAPGGPYGAATFPGGMPMLPDQTRLFQGLVAANRANGNAFQPGQEGAAPGNAATGQGFAGIPAATLQQLYQPGGPMDPTQMMMGMGFPAGLATGNPFLPAVAAMRTGAMGGTRLEDMNLATSLPATNLYRSPAIPLSLPCDDEHLSEYQILVRQQLELFEAEQDDVDSNTQGRKKQVTLGQVGLRCKHCAALTLRQRGKGSVYYPTKLTGIYQAAQNMASSHLSDACQCIDDRMKNTLMALRQRRDTASGGKQYWADGAKALGLYETETGLKLSRQPPSQPFSS